MQEVCGLHDEAVEHILFDYNCLEQKRAAFFSEFVKRHRVPGEELVAGYPKILGSLGRLT